MKQNNKGFTLVELMVCFVLLGILMVAAAQVISSSSQVYYFSKSTSYGIQASQIIATEVRGDLEDAVIMYIDKNAVKRPEDSPMLSGADGCAVYISSAGDAITFINGKGEQICYSLQKGESLEENVLTRSSVKIYDDFFNQKTYSTSDFNEKVFDSKYVGMGYRVKEVKFYMFNNRNKNTYAANLSPTPMPTGDYPVIVLELTVNSPQYGDYTCTEYIPLYNFYGIETDQLNKLVK